VDTKKLEQASAASKEDDTSVNTLQWAGAYYQMLQSLDMRDEILLNTTSSTSIFSNKDYVAGIKESDGKLELHTNGGPIYSNETASVDKFGKVWYNKDSVANIFSFTEMRKLYWYCITYNSENEDAFIVNTPERQVRFKPLKMGSILSIRRRRPTIKLQMGGFNSSIHARTTRSFLPQGKSSEPKSPKICFNLCDVHPLRI
jgi:hypothetical protein